MASSDYKVELVDSSGQADMTVSVVGDQVVDLTGATPGEVLTIQPDGTVAPDPAGTPGAHAATHASGGTDPVTLAQSQITGLTTALTAKVSASLFDANTILAAATDDTPAALTVGASTFVGRKAAGGISAMSVAEAKTVLGYVVGDVSGAAPLASPTFTGTVGAAAITASGLITAGTLAAASLTAPAALTLASTGANVVALAPNGGTRVSVASTGVTTLTCDLTFADTYAINFNTATGTKIGTTTGQKFAFHGAAAVIQRAGAAQAAVATTGSALTSFGYTTAAQADAIVALVNELRAAMVEKGLIKGAA